MKRVLCIAVIILLACALTTLAQDIKDAKSFDKVKEIRIPFKPTESAVSSTQSLYVHDAIVVEFKEGIDVQPVSVRGVMTTGLYTVDKVNKEFQVTKMYPEFPKAKEMAEATRTEAPDLSRYYIVKFDSGRSLDEVVKAFSADPNVDHVEKIGVHPVFESIPNDPRFLTDHWNFYDTDDNDVDATDAWDLETGDASVILGDLDTGLQYNSRDLGGLSPYTDGNVWINWPEYNGTPKVDDDGNGYVDDWVGWDFVHGGSPCYEGEDCYTEDNEPTDFNGHGTHVGGIMGAITNNEIMVSGLAGGWNTGQNDPANGVKVMALRIGWSAPHPVYDEVGYVRMDFAAQAMYYAANKGVTAVNCSWGSSNSGGLGAAIDYAIANGVLVCAAAGNDGDSTPDYLGQRTDVINVCAVDSNDVKPWWSDYGTWVDVSAPGVWVISTYSYHYNPNYVAWVSGTSQASPHATGLAGLLKSYEPSLTRQELYDLITTYTEYIDDHNPSYAGLMGSGRLNAHWALDAVVAPSVTVIQPNGGEVLYIGQIYTIMWDATDNVGIVSTTIEYSVDSGQSFWVIAELEGNPGEWDWTVTGPPSTQCRVKVTCCDAVGKCGSDMSDEDFCPPYKVVANFSVVAKDADVPRTFALAQNYPNPFNPSTRIAFDLPKDCDVDLSVYNVLGQKVETLIGRKMVAGHHEAEWNAESDPSGVYFYVINAGEYTATRQMVLMK